MSSIDPTTKQMIDAALARHAKSDTDSVVLALLDARFRSFEIDMRIDTVIAGVRAVRGTLTVPMLDVA